MVSIVAKKIKGTDYLYLVGSIRKNEKVVQKTIKYIGKKRHIFKEEFECMVKSYKNKDWFLNDFKDELSYKDHEEMRKRSDAYKEHLRSLDSTSRENEREKFLSVFIANSNAIEGSTLTVKETYNYLFSDVSPKGHKKKELYMASNLMSAWIYLEKSNKKFPTHNDLFELHKLVNRNIESEETLGNYKRVQNYVGDVYTTSYLFVEEKMTKLLKWVKIAFEKIDDFEAAFQSHAQFEIIHPFVDGNGRVGRLLLNWVLMNNGLMPLAISVSKRGDYISALNSAQRGNLLAISKFCYGEYIRQYDLVV